MYWRSGTANAKAPPRGSRNREAGRGVRLCFCVGVRQEFVRCGVCGTAVMSRDRGREKEK